MAKKIQSFTLSDTEIGIIHSHKIEVQSLLSKPVSFSNALGRIIREWKALKGAMAAKKDAQ